MKSLVLFTIGGALLVIALATGCKSDDAAAKKPISRMMSSMFMASPRALATGAA